MRRVRSLLGLWLLFVLVAFVSWQPALAMRMLANVTQFLVSPVTPTVSVLEALWFIGGTAALRFNIAGWWLRRRILNRASVLSDYPSRHLMLARARHEAEINGLIVQFAFWTLGLLALFAPEPQPRAQGQGETLVGLLAAPVLLLVQWLLALTSYRQRWYDNQIGMLPIPPTIRHSPIGDGPSA